ncbi:CD48 antigen-like isoform X2 [Mugil cephalus]|uniref:CD48 antigen-like isoform X2 n=1 Tax=Mugil cephalus TaxID=48193 RepID=UPI001FB81B88|nr:CD48 antigen-like isoform X2 [Mugil cephalus]
MKTTFYQTLIVLVILCGAYSVTNKTVGDEIILDPGSKVENITSITWIHDGHIVAEWYKVSLNTVCYEQLKGRCKLDTTTGELTIFNLTLEDSGIYKAEINTHSHTTELKVFSPVPKPTITIKWNDEKTHCVLTCEGITTDVGPVNYTWWSDNKIINESKELIITKEEMNSGFICEVKNPVGSKRSEEFINPFITNKNQTTSIIPVVLIPLGFVIFCVCVILCQRRGRHVNEGIL